MKLKQLLIGIVAIASLAACQKADPYMTLSQKNFTIGEEGGKLTFELTTNVYYRVNNDMDWAKIEIVSTNADKTIFEMNVQANTKTEARKGTVRIIGDCVTPLKIVVSQAGKTPIGVNVEEINVGFTETKATFIVLGNKPWTASCDNADFVLSATEGTGETAVQVTFPENTKTTPNVAVVTVTIGSENYTVTITQDGAPSTDPVDLSAAGTSNCYLIDKVGYYKFKATVRGTGKVPESCKGEIDAAIAPVKADVLWCTYNTQNAPASKDVLITGVALEDGYVVFNTTNLVELVSGNVIIAVYDASDVILWTWHIWFTGTPAVSEIGGATWMDRNLGAVNATKGDAGSIGLLYQWGRKDPMRSASSFDKGDFIATCPEPSGDEVTVANTKDGGTTIEFTIANPRTFIYDPDGKNGAKDWVFKVDHADRWMDDQKTMFDPCPLGYKVPSSAQMQAYASAAGLPTGSTKYSSNPDLKEHYNTEAHVFETSLWALPIAGYISYDNGNQVTEVNICSKYATSSRASGPSSYYFNGNASAFNFTNTGTCAHAASVRCVKE